MHSYDYSFLTGLPLPKEITSLLTSLRRLEYLLTLQVERDPAQTEEAFSMGTTLSLSGAVRLRDVGFPGYKQALNWAQRPHSPETLGSQDIVCINCLLLPESAPLNHENSQALDLAVSAYHSATASVEPLLLGPCLALDLICLSPFQTGSHGTALLLARTLLSGSGYAMCRYLPIEWEICRFQPYYQRALEQSSAHWAENGSDCLPYVEAFLSLLYLAYRQALAALPQRKVSKKEQIELLVLGSSEPISKGEISAALPEVSVTTIEAVLGVMVKAGTVQRLGGGRATRYLRT